MSPDPTQALNVSKQEAEGESYDSKAELPSAVSRWRYWRAWLYGLLPVVVIMFGAGRNPWARGLALTLIGLGVMLAPPVRQIARLPRIAFFALAAFAGLGLLPAGCFGPRDDWRVHLTQDWGIPLPGSLSPDWYGTLEGWMVLMAGLLWFSSCLGQSLDEGGRRRALRLLVLGAITMAGASLMDQAGWFKVPWWPRGFIRPGFDANVFGPFANPNHSSSFFALSCVLCAAMALDSFRRRSKWLLIFAPGLLILMACVLSASSRAGLLLTLTGLVIWLGTSAIRSGGPARVVVSFSIVLAVVSLAIISGGRVGQKLIQKPLTELLSSDLRVWLAEQTWNATTGHLWAGRGIGVFDPVFPHVSTEAYPDARLLHPESDVLWLLFEGGLLCLLPCALIAVWLWHATGPWIRKRRRRRSEEGRSMRRIQRASAIAAGMALCHSAIDVPLHALGYALFFAMVAALGVRQRHDGPVFGKSGQWIYRTLGGLLTLWGAVWLGMVFAGLRDTGLATESRLLHDRAALDTASGRYADAMARINRAIELSPLHYRNYFLRAQLHLLINQDSQAALLDFGRVRAVEPRYAPICFEEGRVWLSYDPATAILPWTEGMRRYPAGHSNAAARFQSIVQTTRPYPELLGMLWKIADRLDLQVVFLETQFLTGDLWESCLSDFLASYGAMEELPLGVQAKVLRYWRYKGNRETLVALIRKHPHLVPAGWQILALDLAEKGQYEEACTLAGRYLPQVAKPALVGATDVPRLERQRVLRPTDPLVSMDLYYAQRAAGDLDAARRTIEAALKLPGAPSFFSRELASVLAEQADWRSAWDQLRPLVEKAPLPQSSTAP